MVIKQEVNNMMKIIAMCCIAWLGFSAPVLADYNRNEAVPVQKVLFGKVASVRHITEHELIEDRSNGWKVFGGALIGGTIGHQFGSGSGRAITTILGAMIGGSLADSGDESPRQVAIQLVELMIDIDDGGAYMVVQELDPNMLFQAQDSVRMIYLADGSVRIDKQM
jgi:outer membrane lipoprotein SlyB